MSFYYRSQPCPFSIALFVYFLFTPLYFHSSCLSMSTALLLVYSSISYHSSSSWFLSLVPLPALLPMICLLLSRTFLLNSWLSFLCYMYFVLSCLVLLILTGFLCAFCSSHLFLLHSLLSLFLHFLVLFRPSFSSFLSPFPSSFSSLLFLLFFLSIDYSFFLLLLFLAFLLCRLLSFSLYVYCRFLCSFFLALFWFITVCTSFFLLSLFLITIFRCSCFLLLFVLFYYLSFFSFLLIFYSCFFPFLLPLLPVLLSCILLLYLCLSIFLLPSCSSFPSFCYIILVSHTCCSPYCTST